MTSRRQFLALAASAAASIGVPIGAAPPRITRGAGALTRSHRRALAGAGGRVHQSAFTLSHLALRWTGASYPSVRLRLSSGWSEWCDVHTCGAGKDGGTAAVRGSLLPAYGAVGYEVATDGHLDGLTIDELNTIGDPADRFAKAPQATMRLRGGSIPVPYLSRAGWRADESLRFDSTGAETWPPAYFPVQTLTVHHTATANDDPNPAATVRAILYYDAITQGWGDIGYQLLIDEAGRVYEGRWSGSDPVPVYGTQLDPAGRPQMVNGAHVIGYNAGNVGVALLGDLTDRQPTPEARTSLAHVLALMAVLGGLDPLATADYVNPISGATHVGDVVSGHRDWLPTECPGNTFYPQLPSLRTQVASLL